MEENVNFDNEVLAYLTVRKVIASLLMNEQDQLIESHKYYIQSHPEIREVLNDFLSSILLHKPVHITASYDYRTMFLYSQRSTSTLSTLRH